ncbi:MULTISPECIES: hypothetical protein [Nocardiopsis]|uniref:Uncharacterized protein n=1 Tax=Nocardiopsis sinuspersici TaxID=501010 RepID=A0A7Z0BJ33_9ACTN|nr:MULTISPECIES: hypothetical protein [Nocardiopsis]NYH51660.1 hypothetical protein [Nocardiopsis sinuspersici]
MAVKLEAISNEWGHLRGVPGEMSVRLRSEEGRTMFVGMLYVAMVTVWAAAAFTGWSWW